MTNHVHLVCAPARVDSLSLVLKPLDLRSAQHVNWTHGISGRLWQGRYFSCPLDDKHFWAAIRYVEHNPVRARMVRRAENYAWSSAVAHSMKVDVMPGHDLAAGTPSVLFEFAAGSTFCLPRHPFPGVVSCQRSSRL